MESWATEVPVKTCYADAAGLHAIQGRLEQLPADLWAQILTQLPLRDVLKARLVSKSFVPLAAPLELDMDWKTKDQTKGMSLSLFVLRHCTAPTSIHVSVTIVVKPPASALGLLPTVTLAASCAHLHFLDCSCEDLDASDAGLCMRLLPASIQTLKMCSHPSIVDDIAWQRLRNLTNLSLTYTGSDLGNTMIFDGSGLSRLPALNFLTVEPKCKQGPIFAGNGFFQASLEVLEFEQDPFDGRPVLAQLPALQTVHAFGSHPIPHWLENQRPLHVAAYDSSQLHGLDLRRLHCLSLTFRCFEQDPPIAIADLLLLPVLKSFGLVSLVKTTTPAWHRRVISLLGSHKEHQALLRKAHLRLEYPAQLSIFGTARGNSVISLRENGHTVVCLCPACCRADDHPCPSQ